MRRRLCCLLEDKHMDHGSRSGFGFFFGSTIVLLALSVHPLNPPPSSPLHRHKTSANPPPPPALPPTCPCTPNPQPWWLHSPTLGVLLCSVPCTGCYYQYHNHRLKRTRKMHSPMRRTCVRHFAFVLCWSVSLSWSCVHRVVLVLCSTQREYTRP